MRLGAGLCLATADTGRWQQVVSGETPTGVGVRLDDREHRVGLGLTFLDGQKIVDVSIDPTSWISCLRSSANRWHEPQNRWAEALASGLRRVGTERGWWDGLPEHLDPEVMAAAAAWPLLRPAIENGFAERAVPRWAAPLVSAVDVATGTRLLLGVRADRRVVREVANALQGPVRWWPIACAVALGQLDAGRIGDLLAESTATYRCTQDELALLACTLGTGRPRAVRQLLASADEGDGPERLLAALDGWRRISGHRRNLPNRLDRLEAAVLAELEVPPPPPQQQGPPRHEPPRLEPPRQEPERQEPPRLELPRANRRRPALGEQRIVYPERWSPLHRARRGTVELILPTSRGDLVGWGQALNNCLGMYANAVATHRVVIAGIRRDEQLVGAVSIDPTTATIRQLEGRNNRALPSDIETGVVGLLAEHGVRILRR